MQLKYLIMVHSNCDLAITILKNAYDNLLNICKLSNYSYVPHFLSIIILSLGDLNSGRQ